MLITGFCYGRSKTWTNAGRFTLVFLSAIASITYCKYLIGYVKITDFDPATIYSFTIIPLMIISYFPIASIIICFVAWKKDGFKKLLPLKQRGLLYFLFWALISIVITAVVVSLTAVLLSKAESGPTLSNALIGTSAITLVAMFLGLYVPICFTSFEFERTTNIEEAEEKAYEEKTRQDAKHQAKIDKVASQERAEAERQILIDLAEEEAYKEKDTK